MLYIIYNLVSRFCNFQLVYIHGVISISEGGCVGRCCCGQHDDNLSL